MGEAAMKRLLVAPVVAGLLVVGLGVSAASAQNIYNPAGCGPGNPVGTSETPDNPPGYGPGNPVGTGYGRLNYPYYGSYGGYGYGGRSYGLLGYCGWFYMGDTGYTYP